MKTVKPLGVSDPFGLARKTQGDAKAHAKSNFSIKQWDNILKMSPANVRINSHGGGCCGAKHLMNFPSYDIMWEITLKERIDAFLKSTPGQTIEAILTSDQAAQFDYSWPKALIKLGFKLVSANTNSNSGNGNYVFHLCSNPVSSSNLTLKAILKLTQQECLANDPVN
jgi:hypothetical protein